MTTSGIRRVYQIDFDVPQFDADGDGPYASAEVLDVYVGPDDAVSQHS
jgi:hypothetical protein